MMELGDSGGQIQCAVQALLCRKASTCLMKWLLLNFREQGAGESAGQYAVCLGCNL